MLVVRCARLAKLQYLEGAFTQTSLMHITGQHGPSFLRDLRRRKWKRGLEETTPRCCENLFVFVFPNFCNNSLNCRHQLVLAFDM